MESITLQKLNELVIELSEKYTEQRISFKNKLDSDDITIGGETSIKAELDKLDGKQECLLDVLDAVKQLEHEHENTQTT